MPPIKMPIEFAVNVDASNLNEYSDPSTNQITLLRWPQTLALEPYFQNPRTISSSHCCEAWNKLIEQSSAHVPRIAPNEHGF